MAVTLSPCRNSTSFRASDRLSSESWSSPAYAYPDIGRRSVRLDPRTRRHKRPWILRACDLLNSLSARVRNEAADLLRPGEDHVGAVSHHTGCHQRRRALLRTIVADVGLEAQVALPEIAHLPVRGGDLIAVAAMIDRLHAVLRIELFEIRHGAAAHHHAARLAAALRGLGRMAGPRYVLEIRQQIGALPRVFHSGKRHGVSRNEVLRVLDPFVERIVGPDDAGGLERGGIAREARQRARPPI